MPKYTFVCDECVVEFDRTLKMSNHLTHPCPQCGDAAVRVWENSGLSFGFAESANASPANTGVHKEDYPTADHMIGKDAEKRWGMIHEREKAKAEFRAKEGTHALIRHGADNHIDYEPMTPTGLNARRRLAKAAIESARSSKEPR